MSAILNSPESRIARALRAFKAIAIVCVTVFLVRAIVTDAFGWLRGPLAEQWRIAYTPDFTVPMLWPRVLSGAVVALLIAISFLPHLTACPKLSSCLLLAAGVAFGLFYQIQLLHLQTGKGLDSIFVRVQDRNFTSYFTVANELAAQDAEASETPLRDFIDNYDSKMMPYLSAAVHASTHPPLPILYYRVAIGIFGDEDHAALIGGLAVMLMGAAALLGVWLTARLVGIDTLGSTRIALLWIVLPGPSMIAPEFDQALSFLIALGMPLLVWGVVRVPDNRRFVAFVLAGGFLCGLACQLSYGSPVLIAIWAVALAPLLAWGDPRIRNRAFFLIGSIVLWTILLQAPLVAFGFDPLQTLINAQMNHSVLNLSRDYVTWLAFNPLEIVMFIGVPICLAAAASWLGSIARCMAGRFRSAEPLDLLRVSTAAAFWLLLISGWVRGEVARIWQPIMPLALVAAMGRANASSSGGRAVEFVIVALAQAAFCAAMALYWG